MNNLSLESRSWNAFFIEDIAEIVSGRDIYEKERLDGLVPYITATANNNGIGYFVANMIRLKVAAFLLIEMVQ